MDYVALKTELTTDPAGLGYAAHLATGSYSPIVDLLAASRAGYTVFRGVIPAYEVINATVPAEWAALTAGEKQRYQTLTGAGEVDVSNANVRAAFAAMFAAGTATRDALVALASRPGSRAEQALGAGITVSADDVARALREG
jgi:hypothetical protein